MAWSTKCQKAVPKMPQFPPAQDVIFRTSIFIHMQNLVHNHVDGERQKFWWEKKVRQRKTRGKKKKTLIKTVAPESSDKRLMNCFSSI